MALYTQRPIDRWPGERTKYPKHSPFNATWSKTLDLLDRELFQLQARQVVLMIDVEERDLRIDGELRANARPKSSAVILAFDSKHGPLKYPCDRFIKWQDNVRAIALGLEALRKVERYGIVRVGEQYTGWKALPPATAVGGLPAPMTTTEAATVLADLAWDGDGDAGDILDVGDVPVPEYVEGAYREAAKRHHPDNGGDPDLFALATRARDALVTP